MEAIVSFLSESGDRAGENQDTICVDDDLGLYVVCDGMGGHLSGKTASTLAANTVLSFLKDRLEGATGPISASELPALVEQAIHLACSTIYNHASKHPECRGMGTTLTLVLLGFNWAVIGHVGDSRVYLYRDGTLDQLSRDHTVVREMIDQGALPESAIRTSPFAHVLSRAVGVQESVCVDVMQLELMPDDRIIVCSDGVSDAFNEDTDLSNLLSLELEKLPKSLVEMARKAGSTDDASVIAVSFAQTAAQSPEEKRRVERIKLSLETLRRIYLFSELNTDELLRVMACCQVDECKKGDFLVRKGDAADSLYMILRGNFDVQDASTKLNTLSDGSHFGEMALLSGGRRNADVKALKDGTLLRLTYDDFLALVNQDPRTGVKLLSALSKELSSRLNTMNQSVEHQKV